MPSFQISLTIKPHYFTPSTPQRDKLLLRLSCDLSFNKMTHFLNETLLSQSTEGRKQRLSQGGLMVQSIAYAKLCKSEKIIPTFIQKLNGY